MEDASRQLGCAVRTVWRDLGLLQKVDGEDRPEHASHNRATAGLIARAIEKTGTRGVSVAPAK